METQKYYFDILVPLTKIFSFFSDASMVSPYGASRSHSLDTPHSLGHLWTSYQPDVEISTLQTTALTSDNYAHAGFEPTIPASEWLQIYALDPAATGISEKFRRSINFGKCCLKMIYHHN
jgi:hypothetical protein